MSKKILLTGATGFLGSHLLDALIEANYELIILKRTTSSIKRLAKNINQVSIYNIDDINYELLFSNHKNIYAIIHTATSYGRNEESVSDIFTANTVFPLELMDAGNRAGVNLFINTDTVLDKYLNLYSFSKNQLLEWGKFFSINKNFNFWNLRLEHFYGAYDDASKFSTSIIHQCLANVKEIKLTKGEQKRDFIHINDVVNAYITLLNNTDKIKTKFFELDIGSGFAVSIKDFVQKIHTSTHSKSHLNFGAIPYREGEVMLSQANTTILKSMGWSCQFDIDSGIQEVISKESFNK